MNSDRQKILTDYISYIYTTGRTYDTIGKYIKHVTDFLEMAKEVNRRGYLNYKRENADVMVRHSLMCSAICDLLSFLNIGYGKREKTVKPLEKLDVISEKNKKLLHDFIIWLTDNNDYSSHTVDIYYTSIKMYFEYANEVNMDNCRRFIKSLEEAKLSPATIRLRITAIEKFSKWMKKPIELKRPKMKRKLDISNVPTENEYNRLLEYLKTKLNKDYYFFIKVLGTTGARLSEFQQFTWEDIAIGEVVLKGKGNKYRRFFFQKQLQQEVKDYIKETGKSGTLAVGRYGPLTQRGFSQHLKAWGKHCGIDSKKMHAHAFRHFFAKMFLKKTKDIIQLADLLGHGSVDQLNELSNMTECIDIYDAAGYVDTEFLMEALSCINTFMDASNMVITKISSLLAPDAPIGEKKKQADEGKKWNVEEILKHCTLENNILKLPQVQFNKKSYAEAKKWIEEAGGSWQGGKIQGFTFPFNPERVFSMLKEGKRCNLQRDYQFFETPADVADWLVMLAGGIYEDDTVLEPSAGRGALIKAIHRACPSVTVECYELMPENREFLHTLSNVILLDEDFTKDSVGSYTKIIANPPFTGNQDIEHVRLMYDRLEEGGTLAAITSQHWKFASEKKCIDFRNWLKEVHGEVFEISAGEFKESGTSISTMAVVIKK